MRTHTLIFLLIMALVGCDSSGEDPITGSFFEKSFIQTYYLANEIQIVPYQTNEMQFGLQFSGERFQKGSETFQILSNEYNDIAYNSELVPYTNNVIANKFLSIRVISDADYNDTHPAGTPLDDIIYISGQSPYDYIKSGYKGTRYVSFDKALKGISATDLMLLRLRPNGEKSVLYGSFSFIVPPTISKTHTITLTITDSNNSTLTAHETIVFK